MLHSGGCDGFANNCTETYIHLVLVVGCEI